MKALKRLALGVLLGLGLVFGGVQSASGTPVDSAADATAVADDMECYAVYEIEAYCVFPDGSVVVIYQYVGSFCPAA